MDGGERIEVTVLGGLDEIAAADWDACAGDGRRPAGDPFTTHRFLRGAGESRARSAAAPAGRRATSSPGTDGAVDRGDAALRQEPQPGRVHLRPQLGARLGARRRRLLPEAAGGRALHPGDRPALPDPPGLRGRGPRRAAAGRAGARRADRRLGAARHLLHRGGARLGRGGGPPRRAPPSSSTGRTAATPTSTPSSPTSPRASARRSARSARGRRPSAARSWR